MLIIILCEQCLIIIRKHTKQFLSLQIGSLCIQVTINNMI